MSFSISLNKQGNCRLVVDLFTGAIGPVTSLIAYSAFRLVLQHNRPYNSQTLRADLVQSIVRGVPVDIVEPIIVIDQIDSRNASLKKRNMVIDDLLRRPLPSVSNGRVPVRICEPSPSSRMLRIARSRGRGPCHQSCPEGSLPLLYFVWPLETIEQRSSDCRKVSRFLSIVFGPLRRRRKPIATYISAFRATRLEPAPTKVQYWSPHRSLRQISRFSAAWCHSENLIGSPPRFPPGDSPQYSSSQSHRWGYSPGKIGFQPFRLSFLK